MTARLSAALHVAGRGLRAAGRAVLAFLLIRRLGRVTCPDCMVDFAPDLTDHHCPICGWQPPAVTAVPRRRGDPVLAGVGAAWFLGAVLFALLAHALYS